MINRDVLILLSDPDSTTCVLNGKYITSIEEHWELGEVFIKIAKHLKYDYNIPFIIDIWEEDYLTREELEKLWSRKISEDFNEVFTEDELEVLYVTGDIDQFIDKIKQNLAEIELEK